jgi:molecular chaperone DnaK (HSP70)
VLITGGCARLAFVRQFVSKVMQRDDAITTEMPEEAAALGACFFGRETVDH